MRSTNKKLQKAYEIKNAKISFVSLVDRAANKRTFLLTKAQDGKASFTTYGRIIKAEPESHYVTGIVYEPMVEDAQNNFMTEEEVTKAAYWFAKNGNKVDLQHSFEPLTGASVVESWIAKTDFEIDGQPVAKGSWLMTVEIDDDSIWKAITDGDISGFSMGGIGDYSEEDVELKNVNKNETGSKKEASEQPSEAAALEKGAVAELYEKRSKDSRFWDAQQALESTLRHYDPVTDTYTFETNEAKIRESLEDFSSVITSILSSGESVAKAIQMDGQPVVKAGKAMSSKNLETLQGIKESLDAFIKGFEPEDEEKKEPAKDPQEEPNENANEESQDKPENAQSEPSNQEKPEDDQQGPKEKNLKKEERSMTQQEIEEAVTSAVAKALEPIKEQDEAQKREQITPETLETMISKAVDKAVAPILKAKGLPTNLNGNEPLEKNAKEQHYLHGIL